MNPRPSPFPKLVRAPFADAAIAVLLGALYVAWLLATERSLGFARDNARQVREALSNEVWGNLNRLYLRLAPVTMDSVGVRTPARLFREALDQEPAALLT